MAIQQQVRRYRVGLSDPCRRFERMFEYMAPTELVVAIADSVRQESMLMARRMTAVAELLALRTEEVETEDADPGYMFVTGFQRTSAEVAAAMNLSPAAATFVVSHAQSLAERLPTVAATLARVIPIGALSSSSSPVPNSSATLSSAASIDTWLTGSQSGTAGHASELSTPSMPWCARSIPTRYSSVYAGRTSATSA